MKRIICLIITALLLCGCGGNTGRGTTSDESIPADRAPGEKTAGVWITYSELNTMLKAPEGFDAAFSAALEKLEELEVNCLYVHVRAFADAYYSSALFPAAAACRDSTFDPLAVMVKTAHEHNMKFMAWINPYRISTSTDDTNKVDARLLAELEKSDICTANNGIYLNPGSINVRRLVIDGVREVINGYPVDGIHFDDYFYPDTAPDFDADSYARYCESAKTPLPLGDWRRANVNALISGTYTAVKSVNDKLLFSVSPTANINGNYESQYADVRAWATGGYVDEIIPQLYFGFEYPNEEFRFERLLSRWQEYLKGTSPRVLIGLAPYKIDSDSPADSAEWQSRSDIVARQISYLADSSLSCGYVLFSYSSLCGDSERQSAQRSHIMECTE